jgi:hypothetical protein
MVTASRPVRISLNTFLYRLSRGPPFVSIAMARFESGRIRRRAFWPMVLPSVA